MNAERITLPHSLEAEREVLAAMLVDPQTVPQARALLTATDFYLDRHALLWTALLTVYGRTRGTDMMLVRTQLIDSGQWEAFGGNATFAAIADWFGDRAYLAQYCGIVREKARLRAIVHAARKTEAAALGGTEEAREIVRQDVQRMREIGAGDRLESQAMGDIIPGVIDELIEPPEMRGIRTGIRSLDSQLMVLEHEPVVIMGRPSHGKTALAADIVWHNAQQGNKGFLCLCEGNRRQWSWRLAARISRVPYNRIRSHFYSRVLGGDPAEHKLRGTDFSAVVNALERVNQCLGETLFISEKPDATASHIVAEAGRINDRVGLDFMVVDHFHKMRHPGGSNGRRDHAMKDSMKELDWSGKDLELTPIVLAQVNRKVEDRSGEDRAPQARDFRECGAAEEDAAVMLGVMLPHKYDMERLSNGREVHLGGSEYVGIVNIAKNRFGRVGHVPLKFTGQTTSWGDL